MHYVKTFSQRMAEGEELKAIESERARQRQEAGSNQYRVKETFPEASKGQTRDKVAEQVSIGSGRTYDKAKMVWDAAKQSDEKTKRRMIMANYDSLTIECSNQELLKALVEGKTGIDGLWFREASLTEDKPTKAYLSVRNGIDWLTAFKLLSCIYNAEVKVFVTFEADWNIVEHHLVFKGGDYKLVKIKANYMWSYNNYEPIYKPAFNTNGEPLLTDGKTLYELISGDQLSDEEIDFIESYFRKVDNLSEQEKLFVATQGESGDIEYLSDYGITKEFTFDDTVVSIHKQGPWVSVEDIKPISNQADPMDCPF